MVAAFEMRVDAQPCATWFVGNDMGSVNCSQSGSSSDNPSTLGSFCMKQNNSYGMIFQGCDAVVGIASYCTAFGCPTKCCQVPITRQQIICSRTGFTTEPNASDFANCTTPCVVDAVCPSAPARGNCAVLVVDGSLTIPDVSVNCSANGSSANGTSIATLGTCMKFNNSGTLGQGCDQNSVCPKLTSKGCCKEPVTGRQVICSESGFSALPLFQDFVECTQTCTFKSVLGNRSGNLSGSISACPRKENVNVPAVFFVTFLVLFVTQVLCISFAPCLCLG